MNFFRRFVAEIPGELRAAQIATTSRPTETAPEPAAWILAPDHPEIWAAFTAIGNSDGVIDHTAANQFVPPNTEEN